MSQREPIAGELRRILALMVESPDDVRVSASRQRSGTLQLTARMAPHDLGKVIGRQGRTARSLRSLLDARGRQDGRRYALEIR